MSILKKRRLAQQFTYSNEPKEFDFGNGLKASLRRAEFVNPQNGKQPYQDHLAAFHKKNEMVGGRRRAKPSDKERDQNVREGIAEHLFAAGTLNGDPITKQDFLEGMEDSPEIFADVLFVIGQRDEFAVPAASAEASEGNFSAG